MEELKLLLKVIDGNLLTYENRKNIIILVKLQQSQHFKSKTYIQKVCWLFERLFESKIPEYS